MARVAEEARPVGTTEVPVERDEPPQWRRFYDSIPPLPRDILVAVLVIGLVMGSLWMYTGQPLSQAPLVVVESGSMMHEDSPYGRLGTIDPGDLILVRDVERGEIDEVVTMYGARARGGGGNPGEGGRDGYGHRGDVVIYRQDNCQRGQTTPIIHRAITWVEVRETSSGRVFSYHDAAGNWRADRPNVDLPDINVDNEDDYTESGWITKGDNVRTNRAADQEGICPGQLIRPEWLIGKARGEIPWIGLLKFMVQGNNVNNPPPDWCQYSRATAPCDLFQMLWITLIVIVAVPLAWDVTHRMRRRSQEQREADEAEATAELPLLTGARPPPPPREGGPPPSQRPRWAQGPTDDEPPKDP